MQTPLNFDAAPGWRGFFSMLGEKHFSPFKTYVDRAHRTVVVLNPKVGTKTFRQALTDGLREVRGLDDPSGGRYRLFRNARRFPFAPLGDYAHALRFPGEYQFFCFVRNPYARLRSAWQNKFAYGHEQGYSRSIRRRELGRLRRHAAAAGLPGAHDGEAIPFTTFLSYVESEPEGRRDHHWDAQHAVLLMHRLRYERFFRMEGEFTDGLRQIFARIGLAGPAVERALTQQRNVSPRSEPPVYTPELAARVHRLYARDFELFGYAEESWQGL
jgi:chondroitin 4-sulfotransferase 13